MKAIVAGTFPSEFKTKVENSLRIRGGWKDNPDMVLHEMTEAAA